MTAWTVVRDALLLVALAPYVYYLLASIAASRFFRRPAAVPPGAPAPFPAEFAPPISILKPIHGLDRETYENYASFCAQDYPEFEILFCVSDEKDPAIPVIEQVIRDFPRRSIRLLIGSEPIGASDKVNKLCRMASEARYDTLLVSDSDVRVGPGFLRAVVAPFADANVGGVTCLYRGLTDGSFAADIEALGNTTDFAPGVLVAWMLGGERLDFMLGAVMVTTKRHLSAIGGFEAFADYFCDDYELGNRLAARGLRVNLPGAGLDRVSAADHRASVAASGAVESEHSVLAALGPPGVDFHAGTSLVDRSRGDRAGRVDGVELRDRLRIPPHRRGAQRGRARNGRSAHPTQGLDAADTRCYRVLRVARQLLPATNPLARQEIRRARKKAYASAVSAD